MTNIIQFTPKQNINARENLTEFVRQCRYELTVFGSDLKWEENNGPTAGISFGNLNQKSRVLDIKNVMQQPFLDFSKAYLRYQQGHNPTKTKQEMPALRCVERALLSYNGDVDILNLNMTVLDQAATIAREQLSAGQAYHTGREIARLALFVSEKHLSNSRLSWKNPNKRPTDTVRTGEKARQVREQKLPDEDALNALADIFASNPTEPRDIFTSSVCAMLLCAPSRVSEILSLPVDCEVWETKRDGKNTYGWRFQPGKGAPPFIKWIPESMETLAQEAIDRVRKLTAEARNIAKWIEDNPNLFYRHKNCPNVSETKPLTVIEASQAVGSPIPVDKPNYCQNALRQLGLSGRNGENTLASIHAWATERLVKNFPWFDQERDLRYSNALFCMQDKMLRPDAFTSPITLWKPTNNTVNDDLASVTKKKGYERPGIFDRNHHNDSREDSLKMTSHQFRHLLNTIAQRGGLSQSQIARWSGRVDMKQNRVYDHMTEFELVAMLRTHDNSLSLDQPLEELALQVAAKLPMTQHEFNMLTTPTAHITEYGFCIHDFAMSACQRFRDCLNCTEQVCIKGDRRLTKIKERYSTVVQLKEHAEQEIADGTAGADRWYEIHDFTEKRLVQLIEILESPKIQDGAIVKLHNENEFSPLRKAVETRLGEKIDTQETQTYLEDMRKLLGGGLG